MAMALRLPMMEMEILEWRRYKMNEMRTLNGYEIVDGWAREEILRIKDAANTPTDEEYFDINNGIIALKEKYRGRAEKIKIGPDTYIDPPTSSISDNGITNNGSEVHNLPKRIVIPEVINGVAVTGLAEGMFYYNCVVEEIVLPSTLREIPQYFCLNTHRLRKIENTEQIIGIGDKAFMNSHIEQALFPNLEEAGIQVFTQSTFLHTVDIGKIQTIANAFFVSCASLHTINGGENVTTIDANAFCGTTNLKEIPFLRLLKVRSIGNDAFSCCGVQFDWLKLTNCTFGDRATPIIDNTTDYWSRIIGNRFYTPCENRLVTLFKQSHPLWANEPIGNTERAWKDGCGNCCVLHIHSALSGKKYATPFEFEAELEGKTASDGTPLLNILANDTTGAEKLYNGLGYVTTVYTGILNETAFQDILDALADGGYVYVSKSILGNVNGGHAVIAYGVNELGEIMFADSDIKTDKIGIYNELFTYQAPLPNVTGPDSDIVIVRKPE